MTIVFPMFNNDRVPKKTWKNGRGDLGLSPKFSDKPIYIHWFHTVNPSIPEHLISKELSNKPSCLVVAYRLFSSRFVWKSGTPKSMVDHRFEITNISGKTTIFSQTQVHISLVQYGWIPCLLIKHDSLNHVKCRFSDPAPRSSQGSWTSYSCSATTVGW